MVTESDAVLATIVDNWGNGGYGGALPKIQSTQDITVDRWAALDAVIVLHDTLDELHPPVNDKYVNKRYTMDIRVTSITSEDQLKLLVEETEYLLNNTAITGFTSVRVGRKSRASSDRGRSVFRNDITVNLTAVMSSSAVAPSAGVTNTFETDELTVNTHITGLGLTITDFLDEDNMASDSAAALASQQSIKAYIDATVNSIIGDLTMYGSANAAWVPTVYEGDALFTGNIAGTLVNTGAAAPEYVTFGLGLPPLKGSLKLYVAGTKIGLDDADAAAYIDVTYTKGVVATSTTNIDTDATNKNSAREWEDTWTAVDASSYDSIRVMLAIQADAAGELDITFVSVLCYYAA